MATQHTLTLTFTVDEESGATEISKVETGNGKQMPLSFLQVLSAWSTSQITAGMTIQMSQLAQMQQQQPPKLTLASKVPDLKLVR